MLLALVVLGLLIGIGCASDDGPDASSTPTVEPGWQRVEALRGKRYCEVLLVEVVDGNFSAQVWNTFGLNECPEHEWAMLDAEAIKAERGVLAALLNGPRYWLMDAIEAKQSGERQMTTFGMLEMFLAATVSLGPNLPDLAPYTERSVARDTVFEYAAGAEVYELLDPDGNVYVMQSYSVQNVDLTEADLPRLASRIAPPAGWTYRARVLDGIQRVRTSDAGAIVIQDELSNTYQLVESE